MDKKVILEYINKVRSNLDELEKAVTYVAPVVDESKPKFVMIKGKVDKSSGIPLVYPAKTKKARKILQNDELFRQNITDEEMGTVGFWVSGENFKALEEKYGKKLVVVDVNAKK